MGELIFMAIIAVIAVFMFFVSGSFPVSIIDKSGGASLFPRIVIVLLLFFMIIRTVIVLRNKEEREKVFVFFEMFRGARLVYLLGTLVYILLVEPLGFVITTSVYLFGMANFMYFKQKDSIMSLQRNGIIFASGVLISLGMYLFFTRVLSILLPQGILGFL